MLRARDIDWTTERPVLRIDAFAFEGSSMTLACSRRRNRRRRRVLQSRQHPTIITTNGGLPASGQIFGDAVIAAATLDRLMHNPCSTSKAIPGADPIRPRGRPAPRPAKTSTDLPLHFMTHRLPSPRCATRVRTRNVRNGCWRSFPSSRAGSGTDLTNPVTAVTRLRPLCLKAFPGANPKPLVFRKSNRWRIETF